MSAFDLSVVPLDCIVETSLGEDLSSGDMTSEACIDAASMATAHAVARHEMIACGAKVFARVFERLDPLIVVDAHVADGTRVATGTRLWTARGRARAILSAERTALNLTQRMCAIATVTRTYVDAVPRGAKTRITDTRKTTPGLRALERYSVRVGGGQNHRDNLGSAILIKDNHVAACGGVRLAIERAKRHSYTCKVECEVDTLAQLDEALAAGADIILLDNMDTATVAEAVRRTAGRALLEASGGITLERVTELASVGVDAISVGALTHSVRAADIGLDFEP
jgi:nicotinate-nucleotide pyrophosphorylase (carboxylating)